MIDRNQTTEYVYSGPTLSGTWIGTWKHLPCSDDQKQSQHEWNWLTIVAELPYRHDLPTIAETTAKRDYWFAEEEGARAAGHVERIRECRANGEQMTRQLARLNALAPGKSCPLPVTLAFVGDAIWVLVPGELYQVFQLVLRQRFASKPVLVATLTGDWQPGYIPPAASFGYGIYQEVIAATSPGSLELLIEDVSRAITSRMTSAS